MKRLNSNFADSQLEIIFSKDKRFRLYCGILFKYYEVHNTFFQETPKISKSLLKNITRKLRLENNHVEIPSERAINDYKANIRKYFNVPSSKKYKIKLTSYLKDIIAEEGVFEYDALRERAIAFINKHNIKSISSSSLNRTIKGSLSKYEQELFTSIAKDLDTETKAYLDGLLITHDGMSWMNNMTRWMRGIKVEEVELETEKLKFLKLLNYPPILTKLPSKHLKRYYRNIISKYPSAIKEMPEINKYALLIIFCFVRKTDISDTLVEILINVTHKIFITGENRSKTQLSKLKEIKKSYNNKQTLKILVDAILDSEDNVVKKAIYPKLSKKKLILLQQQLSNDAANTFNDLSYSNSRSSFSHYYRKIIAPIIEVLDFDSGSEIELTNALKLIKQNLNSRSQYYPKYNIISLDQVVKLSHKNKVLNDQNRIRRIDFELCVMHKLRNKLRIREVWIEDGYKYRNPEKDLPQDFGTNKEKYFSLLDQPIKANDFIKTVKNDLKQSLNTFNADLPKNKHVQILKKPKGHIKVAKIKAQEPPKKLELIKAEVCKRWPSTNLLDVLKETDFFVNFLDNFVVSGSKVVLDKESIRKRLLLAILGYGTNTGLKSMCSDDISYQDLQYIKLRYLTPDNLQTAIRKIINDLLQVRFESLWGNSTTSVASDSKHFHASNQNLMSSWHARYHSNGVLIYWHVDTGSVCIYSQLKGCNSSEVASMLEGVLKHATNAKIDKNYVDTHGASEVGFAFSYLFNFALMPRFKNIHKQKLYYAESKDLNEYSHLEDIMVRPINWALIEKHYEYIIQHAAALKLGITDTEAMLKKFTRDNLQHEAYQAIRELGRAIKTIFLCKYLSSLELRREIHSALNVVERWNGVNDFIFYGKTGSLRSNNPLELKLSILCLHLLQLSMVYINTLMLQQVLVESNWLNKMDVEDKRAISPLINEHINPYGSFNLDLNKRLSIKVSNSLSRVVT